MRDLPAYFHSRRVRVRRRIRVGTALNAVEQAKQGIYPLPIAELFDNAVTIGMGQAPVKKYNEYLRDLIIQGRATPGKIVSHHIKIDKAPEAYEKFDKREDGYTKVLIRFDETMAA